MTLAEIGKEMISQDNLCTAAPLFVVTVGTRHKVFFTRKSADKYMELEHIPPSYNEGGINHHSLFCESANDNEEILSLMGNCIKAAGLEDSEQAYNAYSRAIHFTRG